MDIKEKSSGILSYFSTMPDFRISRKKQHLLTDIIGITIVGTLCGLRSFEEMADFARYRIGWFKQFLELPNGIPSHDTLNRVFSMMDPIKFEACFRNWTDSLFERRTDGLISIDGKTLRGAKSHGARSPIHMVSAWASDHNLVMGQVKVNEKSNEITAIPELLDSLFIKGSIISIDAMGCQQNIAARIVKGKANYLLAVKNNQAELYQNMEDSFRFLKSSDCSEKTDVGHGRIETRKCTVMTDLSHIEHPQKWDSLAVLIKMETTRIDKMTDKTECAIRYYIASKSADAAFYQDNIRQHWSIENKLHWVLDVVFQEDSDRKRIRNTAQNMSLMKKVALNILKNEGSLNMSMKRKMNIASWDTSYIEKLLNI